jgi:hypothetical protein
MTNLAVLPGLGSLAAGRKVGYAQATLALLGFGATLVGGALMARKLYAGEPEVNWWAVLAALGGMAVFALGWLWALVTCLDLHRVARENERCAGHEPIPPVDPSHPHS